MREEEYSRAVECAQTKLERVRRIEALREAALSVSTFLREFQASRRETNDVSTRVVARSTRLHTWSERIPPRDRSPSAEETLVLRFVTSARYDVSSARLINGHPEIRRHLA